MQAIAADRLQAGSDKNCHPMRCYSLLLGARNPRRVFTAKDDQLVRSLTRDHFPAGFTIVNGTGTGYDSAKRRFVTEQSRQILVTAASVRPVRTLAKALADALHQYELLLIELGRAQSVKRSSRP